MSSIFVQSDSLLRIYIIFNTSLINFKLNGLPFFKEYLSKIKIKTNKNKLNPINSYSSNNYTKKLLNWKPKIKIEDSINDLCS